MAETEYDPYEHREVVSPLSNFGAFVSLINCVVGTGVLALPLAFSYAGILTAIFLLLACTFIIIHGMQLLIIGMVECSRRMEIGYATFPQAMAYSFAQGPRGFRYIAKAGGYIVDGTLGLSHFGVCVVYTVFSSTTFKQIVDFYWHEFDVRIYVTIVGLLTLPIFMIQSLKKLVPLNIIATCLVYGGFLLMFYYLFTGLPPLSERNIIFGKIENIGLFFGIAMFSVSSVGVMLAVEKKMAHPKVYIGWFGILDIAVALVLVSYVLFGFMGYWRFGEALTGSISLSLPSASIPAQVSKIMIAVNIYLTYPLSGYVVIDIVMTQYWNKRGTLKRPRLKEIILRIVFCLATTLNGVIAPQLGPLLSLVGAFTISLLNLIFPALIEICLYYQPQYSYGRFKWKLWKDIFLIIVGTIILVQGTIFAIAAMIREYGTIVPSGGSKGIYIDHYCWDASSNCSLIIEH